MEDGPSADQPIPPARTRGVGGRPRTPLPATVGVSEGEWGELADAREDVDRRVEVALANAHITFVRKERGTPRLVGERDDEDTRDGMLDLALKRLGDAEVVAEGSLEVVQQRRHLGPIAGVTGLIDDVHHNQLIVSHAVSLGTRDSASRARVRWL